MNRRKVSIKVTSANTSAKSYDDIDESFLHIPSKTELFFHASQK